MYNGRTYERVTTIENENCENKALKFMYIKGQNMRIGKTANVADYRMD